MKNYLIIAVFVLSLLCGCGKEKETNKVRDVEKGDIVLIFKDAPENWRTVFEDGSYTYRAKWGKNEVGYTPNGYFLSLFFPDSTKLQDTLIIKEVKEPIEIIHLYKGYEELSFITYPNDTLFFEYDDKVPVVKILNINAKEYDFKYETFLRRNIYKKDLSGHIKHSLHFLEYLTSAERKKLFKLKKSEYRKISDSIQASFKKKYFAQAEEEFQTEEKLLDSLATNNLMSSEVLNFYKQRLKYNKISLGINSDDTISFKDYPQQDSLLRYSFYREFLEKITRLGMERKVELIRTSNGSYYNPTQLYDSIQQNSDLTEGTRKYLSFVWMKKICGEASNTEILKYYQNFKNSYAQDTTLVNFFVKKYNLSANLSEDIDLMDDKGRKTTWNEVLKKNKGKTLYVDFWASWCAPCKRILPLSHQLKKQLDNNDDIVFIYLALNDDEQQWKKTIGKVGLADEENSYFITNSKTSSMIEELKIGSIPRYIIYNKDGKISYKNAPRPNNKGIRKLLEEL